MNIPKSPRTEKPNSKAGQLLSRRSVLKGGAVAPLALTPEVGTAQDEKPADKVERLAWELSHALNDHPGYFSSYVVVFPSAAVEHAVAFMRVRKDDGATPWIKPRPTSCLEEIRHLSWRLTRLLKEAGSTDMLEIWPDGEHTQPVQMTNINLAKAWAGWRPAGV